MLSDAQLAEAKAITLSDPDDDRDEALLLALLVAEANVSIGAAVDRWAEGTGAWSAVTETATEALTAGYAEAHRLGRSLAGDATEDAEGDMAAALLFWLGTSTIPGEVRYWEGLTRDVMAGVYGTPGSTDDPPKTEALKRRAQSYTRRFRMMGYVGWVAALPEGSEIQWVMGDPVTQHCDECPDIAAGGPYTAETLPTLPGSPDLPCQSNCLCSLVCGDLKGF